jgi:hypothetical protein
MRPPRAVPPGARLIADAMLVALVILALAAVVMLYPDAPTPPRFPPQTERPSAPALPR